MKFSLTKLALKVFEFVVGIGASTPLFSNPCRPFDGFYTGVMGGVLQSATEFSAENNVQFENFFESPAVISSSQKDVKVYNYHGEGALNFGYGRQIRQCMFIAGELFLSWANRDTLIRNFAFASNGDPAFLFEAYNVSLTAKTATSLRTTEFAFDLRPGYIYDSRTLLFGRVGVGFNQLHIRHKADFEFNGFMVGGHSVDTLSAAKRHNKAVLRLGVGGERKIYPNLALTADYIFSYYGRIKTHKIGDSTFNNGEDVNNTIPNGFQISSSARTWNQAFMIGIKYYFK